jgi:hypothetical protein
MFVEKDEFPSEDDVIQHAKDLIGHERFVLRSVKDTLHFIRKFGQGTPLEQLSRKLRRSFAGDFGSSRDL